MSENEFEEFNGNEGFKNLRKALKDKDKLLKEAMSRLERLEAQNQRNVVNDTLAARGLDPRVAKFYPKDEPTDEESVDKWIAENAELFGGKRTNEEGGTTQTTLSDSEIRGFQVMQDLAAADYRTQVSWESKLKEFDNKEDLMAFLRSPEAAAFAAPYLHPGA